MEINNPQTFDHIKEYNGDVLKPKLIDIGGWDMDTTEYVIIDTGIDFENWVSWLVMIRANDVLLSYVDKMEISQCDEFGVVSGGAFHYHDDTDTEMRLWRIVGRKFDDTKWSGTGSSRGTILLWYKV